MWYLAGTVQSSREVSFPIEKRGILFVLAMLGFMFLVCVLAVGCNLGGDEGRRLEFLSSVRLNSAGQTEVTVVVRNVGDVLFSGDEEIEGRGEVFNSSEQLLARFSQRAVGRLAVDEEATVAVWQGTLEPDTYLMRWTTPRHGGVELEFTLLKRFGVLEVGTVREIKLAPDPTDSS